jgi:beta-lactamase regulating signal transducer with metallopeptidase domain
VLLTTLASLGLFPVFSWLRDASGTAWSMSADATAAGELDLTWLWVAGAGLACLGLIGDWIRCIIIIGKSRVAKMGTVEVLVSDHVASPCVIGLFRSKVCLPAICEQWSEEQLRVVLLHEMCHLRRHDVKWLFLSELVCCALWFHPFAYWLRSAVRQNIEDACDVDVLEKGVPKRVYAECLLDLAAMNQPRLSPGMASRNGSALRQRLQQIMRMEISREAPQSRFVIALLLLAAAALAGCQDHREKADTLANEADVRLSADPFPER